MRGKLILGVSIFAVGALMGAKTVTPEVDFVEVPRTKIIREKAPPPVEIEVVSEACLEAIKWAGRIYNEANGMYDRGRLQLEINSEARRVRVSGGSYQEVDQKQRDLNGRNLENLSDMTEAFTRYSRAKKECNAATATD